MTPPRSSRFAHCGSPILCWAILLSGCVIPLAGDERGHPDYLEALCWPKGIDSPVGMIAVYSPQLETFSADQVTAQLAMSVMKPGASEPIFGGARIKAWLLTDRQRWIATLMNVEVVDVRFPQAQPEDAAALQKCVSSEIPNWQMTMTLDHLRAELALVEREQIPVREFRTDPPDIIVRTHAAILLTMDGEPSWRALPGTPLERLSNSDYFVVRGGSASACYLHASPFWWTSGSVLGPWTVTDAVPEAVRAALPGEAEGGTPLATPGSDPQEPPEVIAATRPTELVWTDGPPDPTPVAGTDLSYVRNTHNDLFLEHRSQTSFLLLSGRWYRSKAEETTWTYVPSEQLPSDFGRIPPGSPKEHVLVSVAGTRQAEDALRDAQIPQTAVLRRGVAHDLVVPYDGPPRFVKIKGSPVQYAENTPYSVFLVRGRYYCCHLAVWYESQGPKGPWEICAAVPSDIYLIPPSCPEYHCTCCYVYNATPDVVYVGYTPGYLGCYCWGPTVVFGTGWPYRGWKGTAWYPRPLTFGLSISYDFGTGCWEFEFGLWGPCAWAGLGYNPGHRGHAGVGGSTGGVSRYRGTGVPSNPGLHPYRNEVITHNLFAGQPRLQTPAPARPSVPSPALGRAMRQSNNVFTDKEGGAYRKIPQGGWEKHTGGGWTKMTPSKPPGASGFSPLEHRLEQRDLARSLGQGGVRELPMHSASAHAETSHPSHSSGPPSSSSSSGSRPSSPPPPKK